MKFDKHIPFPDTDGVRGRNGTSKYDGMEVGDSFLTTSTKLPGVRKIAKLRGWVITVRTTPEGLRLWRIK